MKQNNKFKFNRYTVTAILFIGMLFFYFAGMLVNYKTVKSTIKSSMSSVTSDDSSSTIDIVKSFISGTEAALNDAVYDKMTLINTNGLFNRIIQKKMINDVVSYNTVYKLNNGQLTYHYPEFGVNIAHKNMAKLKEYLDTVGTELLYVQAPYKVDKYDNQLPHKLPDYPNANADKFLAGLDKLGINYIDFRKVIHDNNFVYEDLFFNTDHHWTTETGFWAYTYLMDYMGDNYGVNYDARNVDKSNFTFTTLEDSFIGSLANRTGTWYAGIDDFTYIYPNFDTSFSWTKYYKMGTKGPTRVGSFEETILFKERVQDLGVPVAYRDNCYFNGNPAIAKITNDNVEDGRVLVVQDSFGKPVSAFLSLNFHQVDVMDLRDYKEMNLIDYLKENEYDYVIVLYNPSVFKQSTYYSQFKFYDYK